MPDIVLMGLRGSGKSTIGQRLAEALRWGFIDLDERVLAHLGQATVADAWNTLGEPAFRAAEHTALAEQLALHDPAAPRIIALGGGTPTIPEAQRLLSDARARHTIQSIYLHAPPEQLAARLPPTDPNRPNLTNAATPLEEIQTIYTQRDPLYRKIADQTIESTTIEETIASLKALLKR